MAQCSAQGTAMFMQLAGKYDDWSNWTSKGKIRQTPYSLVKFALISAIATSQLPGGTAQ